LNEERGELAFGIEELEQLSELLATTGFGVVVAGVVEGGECALFE
jgi:hypothetical protein